VAIKVLSAHLAENPGHIYHISVRTLHYDITPDGKRFLMVCENTEIHVVTHGLAELEQLVPSGSGR